MCCCAIASMPPPEKITPDTPLRLEIAATLAFPDGSMTEAGLRREGARGRLVIERIAGKDFTTLANIERMRELCRVEAKGPRLYLRRARPSIGPCCCRSRCSFSRARSFFELAWSPG